MEAVRIRPFFKFSMLLFSLIVLSCSAKYMKVDDEEKLKVINEFDSTVKITAPTGNASAGGSALAPAVSPTGKSDKDSKAQKKSKKKVKEVALSGRREPDLEDDAGFDGRRPLQDPFRVGEIVTHRVKYFKMEAGTLAFKVDPFVEVNGRKSYTFTTEIRSSGMFSSFYSVDDRVVTHLDFDLLIPRVFTMHVKETGQLREARSFFDFDRLNAKYWEKKVTEKSGVEEKKLDWEILPYSQNVFSALFYMRVFKWDEGKTYAFRVADDGENLIFKAKAIRKEELDTDIGKFKTVVIKPEIMVKGMFKPVGDIYIWMSDDDRKLVLRIESKIKIGTLVSEVTSIAPAK